MAVAIMASGCGKFVRDELITMQNEIDELYTQVEQMNNGLNSLRGIITEMADNGYIVKVEETKKDDRDAYTLTFKSVKLDESGDIVSRESQIDLFTGVDGRDGEDAEPFVAGVKKDDKDGRWYWYDNQANDWMKSPSGERFLVDGKDGKTPHLKIEKGYWYVSWDGDDVADEQRNWEKTEWKAQGDNAKEIFSKAEVFDDRVELTLASDSTVLTIPLYQPATVELSVNGKELTDSLLIAPGETIPVSYLLKGTVAAQAIVVAGTAGRMKTAIQKVSDTTGVVKVTCPETFPEGGYVYITMNDGNGRSIYKVVHFFQRTIKVISGKTEYNANKAGESVNFTFETNAELEATCIPEGEQAWITATMKSAGNVTSLTYVVQENKSGSAREGYVVVTPKDNPSYEVVRIKVTQEG